MGKSINESIPWEEFQSAPYRIETVDDVPLPFCPTQERELDKVIDLVVCMAEHSSAKAALEDFDINICKCAWDGHSFSIADPHNTFRRHSTVGPEKRKEFLSSYHHHFNCGVHDQIGDVAAVPFPFHPSGVNSVYPTGVHNVIGHSLAAVQDGIELPLPLLPGHSVEETEARTIEMHICTLRTFERIEKYSNRGIVFDDNFTVISQEFQGLHKSLIGHVLRRV